MAFCALAIFSIILNPREASVKSKSFSTSVDRAKLCSPTLLSPSTINNFAAGFVLSSGRTDDSHDFFILKSAAFKDLSTSAVTPDAPHDEGAPYWLFGTCQYIGIERLSE